MSNLKALRTRIIFRREEAERTTSTGILLTAPESDPNPLGTVIDIGPDVVHDIKMGDEIVVNWQFVSQMTHEGQKYYVVDQANVLAVREKTND